MLRPMDPLNVSATGAARARAGARADARAVFGEVMGLVGLTCGFAALGAWIGRDLTGLTVLVPWLVALVCLVGLNVAAARGQQTLAITLLFVVGLAMGIAIGNTVHVYTETQPEAVYQAAGATGLFVGGLGAAGYATRRDLSFLYRGLFFALLALIGFGLIAVFVAIPGANVIYCVAGLVIFGGYTVVDFNRLRRAGTNETVPLAAGIFLDVLNVFLFFLSLFGGRN
jgi:FtsH-binding integral membrane protein